MRVKFAPMTANPLHDPSHASPLGKATEYQSHYAPELLYPIPRQLKRSEIGIVDAALPFVGEDLWNAYELSWLNPKGKPMVAVGCFRVPVDSPNLIESKSFKLYLNSFNHTRFESLEAVSATMARDLSATAGRPVGVALQALSSSPTASIGSPDGILIDDLDIECDRYQPARRHRRGNALFAPAEIQLPGHRPTGLGHGRHSLSRSADRPRRPAPLHRLVPQPQ